MLRVETEHVTTGLQIIKLHCSSGFFLVLRDLMCYFILRDGQFLSFLYCRDDQLKFQTKMATLPPADPNCVGFETLCEMVLIPASTISKYILDCPTTLSYDKCQTIIASFLQTCVLFIQNIA